MLDLLRRKTARLSWASAAVFLSLTAGFVCCALLGLIALRETSYDDAWPAADRTYRIQMTWTHGDVETEHAQGPSALVDPLADGFPGIEAAASLLGGGGGLVRVPSDPNALAEIDDVFLATSDLFDVLPFRLSEGDLASALATPNGVVLSHKLARQLFGDRPAVGESIVIDVREPSIVTAVVAPDQPLTHVTFDALLPTDLEGRRIWNGYVAATYVRAAPGVDPDELTSRINAYVDESASPPGTGDLIDLSLLPIADVYLHSNTISEISVGGDPRTLYAFAAGALLVLLMAALNHVTLSTAQHQTRSIEVGVRKTIGASAGGVVRRYLGQSLVTAVGAAGVAFGLVVLLVDPVGRAVGIELVPGMSEWGWVAIGLASATLVIGLGAGWYPALLLARLDPVAVLRSGSGTPSGFGLRRVLVAAQLAATLVFVLVASVVWQQVRWATEQPMGMDASGVVFVRSQRGVSAQRQQTLQAEWNALGIVESVSAGRLPGEFGLSEYVRDSTGASMQMPHLDTFPGYLDTFGIELIAGREIAQPETEILLNERAARIFGLRDPVGASVEVNGGEMRVVGVTRDFRFFSLHDPIPPLVIRESRGSAGMLFVRTRPGAGDVVEQLHAVWERVAPGQMFSYGWVDGHLNAAYHQEQRMARVFGLFALLAVAIALSGLVGMTHFAHQRRSREVAVRKTFGAPTLALVRLLARETAAPFLTALVIGLPVAYVLVRYWLGSFAYAVAPLPTIISVVVLLTLVLSLFVWALIVRALRRSTVSLLHIR